LGARPHLVPARSPKYVTIRRLSNPMWYLAAGIAAANWAISGSALLPRGAEQDL